MPIELHTVYSPYRELTRPMLEFLDEIDQQHDDDIITVVIPEFVTSWRRQWLHNGSAFALKARLLYRPHTAVVSVPVHMHDGVVEEDAESHAHASWWAAGASGSTVARELVDAGHEVVVDRPQGRRVPSPRAGTSPAAR